MHGISFTLSIYYDSIINSLDRSLTPHSTYSLSSSVWRYALQLIHEKTQHLTIPENDGKMYTVTLNGMEVIINEL